VDCGWGIKRERGFKVKVQRGYREPPVGLVEEERIVQRSGGESSAKASSLKELAGVHADGTGEPKSEKKHCSTGKKKGVE